jgi:hypothetical protein
MDIKNKYITTISKVKMAEALSFCDEGYILSLTIRREKT